LDCDIARVAANEKDKIFIAAVSGRKGTTNVGMDALKKLGSTMCGMMRKGDSFDVGDGANGTWCK
jgi:hypothetical protein